MTSEPVIELRWWAGCPSTDRAAGLLADALTALGEDPARVVRTEIADHEQAVTAGFPGSPTFVVGGRDVLPQRDAVPGLTCRLYRLRDGRPSPTPDPDDLRDALRAALTPMETETA